MHYNNIQITDDTFINEENESQSVKRISSKYYDLYLKFTNPTSKQIILSRLKR